MWVSLRPTRTWHPNPSLVELKLFAWPFYLEVIIKLGVVHFDFEVVSSAMEMERGAGGQEAIQCHGKRKDKPDIDWQQNSGKGGQPEGGRVAAIVLRYAAGSIWLHLTLWLRHCTSAAKGYTHAHYLLSSITDILRASHTHTRTHTCVCNDSVYVLCPWVT